jgi:MFS family permease
LTIYIVFQVISSVLFGPLSDTYGRRPVLLFTLAIYLISNIGLAANEHNYAALLIVRALQRLGASAAHAIAFGVVAGVCVQSERGRMLGPISMALNLGACVGPVVGGVVAYLNRDHIWVFWVLVIVSVLLVVSSGVLLPETARSLVGNGADHQRFEWWQLSWLGLIKQRTRVNEVG